LEIRSYRVVTGPFYENGHVTDDAVATGQNGCLGKRNEKANQDLLERLEARTETNRETDRKKRKAKRKADQEDLKRMMEEMKRGPYLTYG
jgi:hypothetical protein